MIWLLVDGFGSLVSLLGLTVLTHYTLVAVHQRRRIRVAARIAELEIKLGMADPPPRFDAITTYARAVETAPVRRAIQVAENGRSGAAPLYSRAALERLRSRARRPDGSLDADILHQRPTEP